MARLRWQIRVLQRLRGFFEGEPFQNERGSGLVFINGTRRHPLASFLLRCRDFWLDHWKWLITTLIAVAGYIWWKR